MPSCSTELTTASANLLTNNFSVSSSSLFKNDFEKLNRGFISNDFCNLPESSILNNQIFPTKLEKVSSQKCHKKSVKLTTSFQTESYHQSQSRNIFEFCLPIGRHSLLSKQDCSDQYCKISPNSLLLKRGTYHSAKDHKFKNLKNVIFLN